MSDDVRRFTTKFCKAPSYQILPATGTWGVFTSDGNILCNFVVESHVLPETLEMEVYPDGRSSEINRKLPLDMDFEKELQVGIIMTPQTAMAVGEWLMNFVKQNPESVPEKKTNEEMSNG